MKHGEKQSAMVIPELELKGAFIAGKPLSFGLVRLGDVRLRPASSGWAHFWAPQNVLAGPYLRWIEQRFPNYPG